MKRFLITGSGGLVGSHLVNQLCENDENIVFAITSKNRISNKSNLEYIKIDFSEPWQTDVLPNEIDTVVHLAQSPFYKDFPDKAHHVYMTNVNSTQLLLDYCLKASVENFFLASTGGVYRGSKNFMESDPVTIDGVKDFYISSKISSELLSQTYSDIFNVFILRFFFVYGPGQNENMLIPRLVNSIRNENPISLAGSDGIVINPTYVSDAARLIISLDDKGASGLYNIGGPELLTLKKVSEIIGKHCGTMPIYNQIDSNPVTIAGDISKIKGEVEDMNWTSFDSGINEYINSITDS